MLSLTHSPAQTTSTTATDAQQLERPSSHFRFLDLPAELRIQIYEELVVVGKVFYTPDDYAVANEKRFQGWKVYRAPSLDILRVCKQVHDEAEEVYLGKNLFVLPDFCSFREPVTGIHDRQSHRPHMSHHGRWMYSRAASRLLKKFSISLNMRTPTPRVLGHTFWDPPEHFNQTNATSFHDAFDTLDPAGRLRYAHAVGRSNTITAWEDDVDRLAEFLPTRLHFLEIDLTNAYCPVGCSRLVDEAFEELFATTRPTRSSFLGVKDDGEVTRIVNTLDYYPDCIVGYSGDRDELREAHGMVFGPKRAHGNSGRFRSTVNRSSTRSVGRTNKLLAIG